MLAEETDESPLPEESEKSASLDVLVSPDESPDDPPPPPLPPPPQEIARKLKINTTRKKYLKLSKNQKNPHLMKLSLDHQH